MTTLSHFNKLSLESLTRLVSAAKRTTCLLDQPSDKIVNFTTAVLNIIHLWHCAATGPEAFKMDVFHLQLKRPNLNQRVFVINYRLVSNIICIAKILEKVVVQQLNDDMVANNQIELLQSEFRNCTLEDAGNKPFCDR